MNLFILCNNQSISYQDILKLQKLEHFATIPTTDKNVTYVEGQGIITTKDGQDTAPFRGYGIETSKGQISSSFLGSVFYKISSTNGKLSFLNNNIGLFETEVDE